MTTLGPAVMKSQLLAAVLCFAAVAAVVEELASHCEIAMLAHLTSSSVVTVRIVP